MDRYRLKFLGSVQVPFHKGNDVLCAAMQKVQGQCFSFLFVEMCWAFHYYYQVYSQETLVEDMLYIEKHIRGSTAYYCICF